MKAIFGLGNPGEKYEKTRHNVGFMFVDYLKDAWELDDFKENKKLKSLVCKDEDLLLIKPSTFMNLSGEAIVVVMNFYKLDLSDILVVYDDIDLELGNVKFLDKGGPGTHNGMKSIVELVGSQEFSRMRIGIENRHGVPIDLSDYVLGKFFDEELEVVENVFAELEKKLLE